MNGEHRARGPARWGGKSSHFRLLPIVISLVVNLSACLVADPDDYRDRTSPISGDVDGRIVVAGEGTQEERLSGPPP